jgi:hypothetical protein
LLRMLKAILAPPGQIFAPRQPCQLRDALDMEKAGRFHAHPTAAAFIVLPRFTPQAPYRFDDDLGFAELNHVPASLGDNVARIRRQCPTDDNQRHVAKIAEAAWAPQCLRHLLQRHHFVHRREMPAGAQTQCCHLISGIRRHAFDGIAVVWD